MPPWLQAIFGFLYHVTPSLIGVIVGGWMVQRYWISRANEAALIEYIAKELTDLVDETLLYWSIDCSGTGREADGNRKQAAQLAAKIKAASQNLNVVLSDYSERYCRHTKFDKLWQEIHNACTNGNFEVRDRSADPHRYAQVVSTTHRLRWKLYERRV